MQLSYEILSEILIYSIGFLCLYFFLYRPYIYSIVDPLFVFVVTTAFGSVLVVETVENKLNIVHYFICQLCVWLGFIWVQNNKGIANEKLNNHTEPQFTDIKLLQYCVYILCIIYVLATIIFLQYKGFALFSDDPSANKITNFQGGLGIFRKINWAVGGVAGTGLIFLYLLQKKKHYIYLLLVFVLLTALEGSKGALVRYAITIGLLVYHPKFRIRENLIKSIKKIQPFALLSILMVFFFVLFKENENTEAVIFAFLRRLLYGTDALLFFYHPDNIIYFSRFSAWDFPEYIVNPILGFFRIAPYQEGFGNIMVDNTLPPGVNFDIIIGPNTSFYTEGQIFFGYYGAFIYSFLLGAFSSYLRALYFSLHRSSAFFFVFLVVIVQFSSAILVDLKFFIAQSFDTLVLVVPVYIATSLAIRRKYTVRYIKFLFMK